MRTVSEEHVVDLLWDVLHRTGTRQATLARRSGVTPKHVNQILNGHVSPRLAMLDHFAMILGYHWEIRLVKNKRPKKVEAS